jgi:hypothetical protein
MFEKIWEQEPDKLDFVDEVTGYKCLVLRQQRHKNLCGYVFLPKDHIFYGKVSEEVWDNDELRHIKVHGGVNFAGYFDFTESDYVIGFDCAHAFDIVPSIYELIPDIYSKFIIEDGLEVDFSKNSTYKTVEYVTDECKKLAKQLKKTDELAKKMSEEIDKLSDEEKELMGKWNITEKDWVIAKEPKEKDEDIEYEIIDAKEIIQDWLTKAAEVNPEAVRIITRQIDKIEGKK